MILHSKIMMKILDHNQMINHLIQFILINNQSKWIISKKIGKKNKNKKRTKKIKMLMVNIQDSCSESDWLEMDKFSITKNFFKEDKKELILYNNFRHILIIWYKWTLKIKTKTIIIMVSQFKMISKLIYKECTILWEW